MRISGAVAAVHDPDKGVPTPLSPGSDGALNALLDHIATELAVEYVDLMEAAANASRKSRIDPTSAGAE
jgi:hypothetical protein